MDAYERLLGDAMAGDATLFARQDVVEAAWAIVDPVIHGPSPHVRVRAGHVGTAGSRPPGRRSGRLEHARVGAEPPYISRCTSLTTAPAAPKRSAQLVRRMSPTIRQRQ